ncbi:MAG TPA: alpha-ketoglutarate-dependent dioxygenase AlkB [Flavobacterium sp.]|jgi:alkylated DNA repair dioxygenase AlkB|nr:alpha-ketoglutarate-dependent dioxygenase AlkB [Flavobacterium sp.]HPJ09037.1 alpha-ketoglutarate-dependent dioxygenase AlkB [Flavobacterium sp.]
MSLFKQEPIIFDVPDADIRYFPGFFDAESATAMFDELMRTIPWQQDDITVFGKTHPQPRLTALFGNDGKPYSYSNLTMQPHPWILLLQKIRYKIAEVCDTDFTSVLLNLYRDGKDSNGWHADNEKELGQNPVIASLSFGAARSFQLKHNTNNSQRLNLTLEHGSLLLMQGTTQHCWKHQIPKTAKPVGPRINLTFRVIV